MALPTRTRSPESRASLAEEGVVVVVAVAVVVMVVTASRIRLMRETTRSVMAEVSSQRRCGASRRMRARVEDRHWLTGSSLPAGEGRRRRVSLALRVLVGGKGGAGRRSY